MAGPGMTVDTAVQVQGLEKSFKGCTSCVVAQSAEVRDSISLAGQFAAVGEILTGRENLRTGSSST